MKCARKLCAVLAAGSESPAAGPGHLDPPDLAQDLLGGVTQRAGLGSGERIDHVVADRGDVPWGGPHDKVPAFLGEGGVRVAAVVRIRVAPEPPAALEAR